MNRTGRHAASMLLAAAMLGAALLAAAPPASACFHARAGVEVEVGQSEQQAVIVHRAGRQDMVMRIGLSSSAPLSSLGWVLPLPALPDHYEARDGDLFEQMASFVDLREVERRGITAGPASAGAAVGGGVIEHEKASAGPYTIQPVELAGDSGIEALNEWMRANDFDAFEPEQLRYYVQRDWVFLAIRVDPAGGAKHLADNGELPPLHVAFATEHAVYPLKFSTHQGVFPTRLYLITDEPPSPADFRGAALRGFYVAGVRNKYDELTRWPIRSIDSLVETRLSPTPYRRYFTSATGEVTRESAPSSLTRLMESIGAWERREAYALSVLYNPHVNEAAGTAADWPEDLAIPALPIREYETPPAAAPPTEDEGCSAAPEGEPSSSLFWLLILVGSLEGVRRQRLRR